MLALAAAIAFGLGFLLVLADVAISARFNLLYLGLTLLALHLAIGTMLPFPSGRRRR